MHYSVSIDVPNLDAGLKFYRDALGLVEIAQPMPGYVILECGAGRLGLMEKAAGSLPAKGSDDIRHYARHWTPVHIDFHVKDYEICLQKLVDAGAEIEHRFDMAGRPPIAFCSDPFGHGFCLLGSAG